jgi:hypothetical protein
MGHYASEMGYTRVVSEWQTWGFRSVPFAKYDNIIECPMCHTAVVRGTAYDQKEDSQWWAHIQWHVKNGERWDWQPSSG